MALGEFYMIHIAVYNQNDDKVIEDTVVENFEKMIDPLSALAKLCGFSIKTFKITCPCPACEFNSDEQLDVMLNSIDHIDNLIEYMQENAVTLPVTKKTTKKKAGGTQS